MKRPMTNAERQRRYIARLKAQAIPDHADLARELAQAKARIAELEAELARTKRKLAKAKQK
jgi:hypothetical protein